MATEESASNPNLTFPPSISSTVMVRIGSNVSEPPTTTDCGRKLTFPQASQAID
jgi:hypothetical protein